MLSVSFWIFASTFISEDVACITAGVLISQGEIGLLPGVTACIAGIFFGDLLLFGAGRLLGQPILRWRLVARYLPAAKVNQAGSWLQTHGIRVVLLSRFTPGLRLPTYFAAGLLRVNIFRFSVALFIASLLWTPLLVGAAAEFGEQLVLSGARAAYAAPAFAVFLYFIRRCVAGIGGYETRRRLVGFLRRKWQWEFWPPWAIYLPLLPYLVFLALRYRSVTIFSAANPGIPSGGLLGESKVAILQQLDGLARAVPAFTLIPAALHPEDRILAATAFMAARSLHFPVVLKPDVGERGDGVAIVRCVGALESYLRSANASTILQQYVAGPEFGVLYYRFPGDERGSIFSITEKIFPQVLGDGIRSLRQLILADERAVCLFGTYEGLGAVPMDSIPAKGISVPLAEIGSHVRGAIFLDATHLTTPDLERAIDSIARAHKGFFIGRFDIRAGSREAFRAGVSLSVLELNGVGGEPTHVYDPAVTIVEAYRSLATQWRLAFAIGSRNHLLGAKPMTVRELLAQVAAHSDRRRRKPSLGDRTLVPSTMPVKA